MATHELEFIRDQVERGLENVHTGRAERLEDYPLARLSAWRPPPGRVRKPGPKNRARKP